MKKYDCLLYPSGAFGAFVVCALMIMMPASSDAAELVAHYKFEDSENLGLDSSGLENHAEVADVEQVEGQFGQAGFFDESLASSFVKEGGLAGFTGKPGVTLAAWVKLDEATTGFDGIISQDSGACCDNRILIHPDSKAPFINLSEHQDEHLLDATPVEIGEWAHIAMTGIDGDGEAEARVYINGVEVEGGPWVYPEMDDGSEWNTYLGVGESGTAHRLTGALDDVRVYEGALTAEEVEQLLTPESTLTNGLIGYWSFNDLENGGEEALDASANENNGTINGEPAIVAGASGKEGDFAISFDGIDDSVTTEGFIMNDIGDYTMSGWVKFEEEQPGNRIGLFGQNDAVEFGMIDPATMQHWTAAGGAFNIEFGPTVEEWTNIVIVATPDERILYVNGEEEAVGGGVQETNSAFNFNIGGDGVYDDVGNFFTGEIDDVAVWDRPLTPEEAEEIFDTGAIIPPDTVDTDGDGMGDKYEQENGLDPFDAADKDTDLDGDTLSNFAEFEGRTNPNSKDTDEDGLEDNVETNTGAWVGLADTGTSPTKADTDKDGLNDGVENPDLAHDPENAAAQPGTNPNLRDSDDDKVGDGFEINGKTDPTNKLSVPTVIRGGGLFATTHIWTEGDPQFNDVFGVEEALEDPGDSEIITIESQYIHFHDNVNAPAFQDLSVAYPLWGPQGNDEGPGTRDDFAIRSVGNINITQAGLITFVCNSDDGFDLRIDGDSIGEAGNRGRGNTFMPIELSAGVHELEFLHWERGGGAGVSVYVFRSTGEAPGNVNEDEWQLLEATGSGSLFQIEKVELTGGKLNITWPSSPGESFAIEQGSDLMDWEEVTDGLEASEDAESTSFELETGDPVPATFYVRVRKEE